ncbi:MAG TPA: hypothetical protein VIK89_16765 [Cytophagaceae bacterium]
MKSILKLSIVFGIAGIVITVLSCKRSEVDYLGPAYVSAPEGFAVTNFSATSELVDFTSDTVVFNADFTHSVSWILTVKGQESGAVRRYSGNSKGFSNIVWTGVHDDLFFFRKGESVTATLSFYGSSYTASTNLTIKEAPDYTKCGQFPREGHFENPSLIVPKPGPPPVYSPYFASFNFPNPIPNVEQGVDSMAIDYKGNRVPSVQGKNYYYIKGKGNQSNFVSGIQYFGPRNIVLPQTADDVWVNMYIYGTGDANAQVELEYQESDPGRGLPGYQGETDDAFVAYIPLTHKGWKLFSFRYSDLTPSKNLAFGGNGNKIHEPHRLVSFNVILVKVANPDSPVEVYFDFPIITVGGPFKPCR